MKISAAQDYAVITGDIVKSSKLSADQRKWLVAELARSSRALRKAFPKDVPLPLELFRGDSWQLLVASPGRSLRLGLFLRAWLISRAPAGLRLDTRMAIAVGTISFVPGRSVSAGDGEAYRASGRALDALREPQRLALVWPPSAGEAAGAVAAFAPAIDAIAQSWTSRQARAVLGRLQDATQKGIAGDWPKTVTRQAVARHLARSRWTAIESALVWMEESNLWRLPLVKATS